MHSGTIEKAPSYNLSDEQRQKFDARWLELTALFQRTIAAIQDEIQTIIDVEAQTSTEISDRIRQIDMQSLDLQTREHLNMIVSENQREDFLRQRHEHLLTTLGLLAAQLNALHDQARAFGMIGDTPLPVPEEMIQEILDAQNLGDVRTTFERHLRGDTSSEDAEEPPATYTPSGDVDLF